MTKHLVTAFVAIRKKRVRISEEAAVHEIVEDPEDLSCAKLDLCKPVDLMEGDTDVASLFIQWEDIELINPPIGHGGYGQ